MSSCSHMRGGPCPQCQSAVPVRQVTVIAGVSHVDGTPVEKWVDPRTRGARRGGQATARKHGTKMARRRGRR